MALLMLLDLAIGITDRYLGEEQTLPFAYCGAGQKDAVDSSHSATNEWRQAQLRPGNAAQGQAASCFGDEER